MGGASKICNYVNCKNNNKNSIGKSFFTSPKDVENKKMWVQNSGVSDNIAKICFLICEDHFEVNQMSFNVKRKRLLSNAIPIKYSM